MAYKFQLGASVLSGSLSTAGDVSASLDISGAVSHVSASGELRGTGLQLKNITGSTTFDSQANDAILFLSSLDGKADGMSPSNLAEVLAGDGLTRSNAVLAVNVDDTGIEIDSDTVQLKDDGVRTAKILSGSVTSVKIGDQQITQRNLGTGSVETNAIKQAAVTMAAMATGSVETNAIKQAAVTMAAMATGSVETAALASGSVTSVKIGDQQIIQRNLGTGSVETNAIKQAAVTMAAMATGSVETNAIKQAAVTMAAMATGSVETNAIKQGAITMAAMATGSLENNAYATGSITQNHIKQGAVTMAAMGTGSVENNAYATGSVEASHLDGDAFSEGLAKLGVGAVELDINTLSNTLTGSSLDGLDVLGIYDNANTIQKKSTLADLAVKLAGSNITATNGVLAAGSDVSLTATAIVNGDKLSAGINYFTGAIQPAAGEVIVSLPEAVAPSVGDTIYVKAPSNCGVQDRVSINVSGTHLIDGISEIVLNDAYAAVTLVYIVSGSWAIV